ncbi:MAG TPA: lipoprotein-releasing ABC transporter permease subunit, partial [Caulobacterales bacterium]|nr:lipoprotein-releasing ABC transporter permease subunit [Caulobacterales bacterium]
MADVAQTQARPFGLFERMLALRYLGAKRNQGGVALISIISFVGIMLAVAVLIITMSVMNGFRETIVSRILGVNGHVYIDMVNRTPEERQRIIAAARTIPGVTHVAESVEGQVLATANGRAAGAYVRGITAENLKALPIIANNIVGGSLDKFSTDENGDVGLLIGYRLASQLGVDERGAITLLSPEGAVTPFGVTPRLKAYAVGAIFNIGMAEYDSSFVYMPLAEAQLFFGKGDGVDRLELRVSDPDNTQAIMRALRAKIGPDLFVSDWVSQNQSLVNALVVERNVMRLILLMIVAIATMNIISGLVMLVKNKGRDIAILRTMGATRGMIMRIFFLSGAAVGAAGTVAGLLVGTLFCIYIGPIQDFVSWAFHVNVFNADVYSLSRIPAKVEWPEVAGVGGFALLFS